MRKDDHYCSKNNKYAPGSKPYAIVAKDIRNSQQLRVMKWTNSLVFMDIGGVTAEEVNKIDLYELLSHLKGRVSRGLFILIFLVLLINECVYT
jgi:hypothetical protein